MTGHDLILIGVGNRARRSEQNSFQAGFAQINEITDQRRKADQVKKEIVVLDGDPVKGKELHAMLTDQSYHVTVVQSLKACEDYFQEHPCWALILDLDTVALDNRSIMRLKKNQPGIQIIAKSDRTFHPELEESLRSAIFACLAKPMDPDELNFWLKSIPSGNGCS
jgi:DNA-binding response OmpR family regulator